MAYSELLISSLEELGDALSAYSASCGKVCSALMGLLAETGSCTIVDDNFDTDSWQQGSEEDAIFFGAAYDAENQVERRLFKLAIIVLTRFLQVLCEEVEMAVEKWRRVARSQIAQAAVYGHCDAGNDAGAAYAKQVTAASVLSFVDAQHELHQSIARVMVPLVGYPPVDTLLLERGSVPLLIRDACIKWMALAEANRPLREGYGLSFSDHHLLCRSTLGMAITESSARELNQKLDSLFAMYQQSLAKVPLPRTTVPACFFAFPDVLRVALKDCASSADIMACCGVLGNLHISDLDRLVSLELPHVSLNLSDELYEAVSSTRDAKTNLDEKLEATRDLVCECIGERFPHVDRHLSDLFTLTTLYLCCPSVHRAASHTAVTLLYGKAHLVKATFDPRSAKNLVYVTGLGSFISVEASSTWFLVEDPDILAPLKRSQSPKPFGIVDATFQVKLSLMDIVAGRSFALPMVAVERQVSSRLSLEILGLSVPSMKGAMMKVLSMLDPAHHKSTPTSTTSTSTTLPQHPAAQGGGILPSSCPAEKISPPTIEPPPRPSLLSAKLSGTSNIPQPVQRILVLPFPDDSSKLHPAAVSKMGLNGSRHGTTWSTSRSKPRP